MNHAFLMKIGWKVMFDNDNLCCKVLRAKYGRGYDLLRHCSYKHHSLIWRELYLGCYYG